MIVLGVRGFLLFTYLTVTVKSRVYYIDDIVCKTHSVSSFLEDL